MERNSAYLSIYSAMECSLCLARLCKQLISPQCASCIVLQKIGAKTQPCPLEKMNLRYEDSGLTASE